MLAETITVLRAAFPRAEFPRDTARVYAEFLADLPDQEVASAVARLVRTCTFMPSIGEIRRAVAEERLGLPGPEEAWTLALHGALASAPEELRDSVEAVGGRWAIRFSGSPETVRAQFIRDYTARRERAIMRETGGLPTPPAISREMRSLPPAVVVPAIPERGLRPRPVMWRLARRWAGHDLEEPTEEECQDAVRVLRRGYAGESPTADEVYAEAERIFEEASRHAE